MFLVAQAASSPRLAFGSNASARRHGATQHAADQQLDWVEDESNGSLMFDRNFLRHQIMPQLQQRWPGFRQRWQQSAQLCGQSAYEDNQLAATDLQACKVRDEAWGWSLELTELKRLSEFRRGNLLRYWLAQRQLATPEHKHLQQVEGQLLDVRADAKTEISWGQGVERLSLRSYKVRLYLLPELGLNAELDTQNWKLDEPLVWGAWTLLAEPVSEGGVHLPAVVSVRPRIGGERCRPAGRAHSQSLKKLLQEYAVEPWLRAQLPLVFVGDDLAAAADRWISSEFVEGSGQSYRLSWFQRTRVDS